MGRGRTDRDDGAERVGLIVDVDSPVGINVNKIHKPVVSLDRNWDIFQMNAILQGGADDLWGQYLAEKIILRSGGSHSFFSG